MRTEGPGSTSVAPSRPEACCAGGDRTRRGSLVLALRLVAPGVVVSFAEGRSLALLKPQNRIFEYFIVFFVYKHDSLHS